MADQGVERRQGAQRQERRQIAAQRIGQVSAADAGQESRDDAPGIERGARRHRQACAKKRVKPSQGAVFEDDARKTEVGDLIAIQPAAAGDDRDAEEGSEQQDDEGEVGDQRAKAGDRRLEPGGRRASQGQEAQEQGQAGESPLKRGQIQVQGKHRTGRENEQREAERERQAHPFQEIERYVGAQPARQQPARKQQNQPVCQTNRGRGRQPCQQMR